MCHTVDAASRATGDRKATLGQLFTEHFPPTLAVPRGRTAAHNRKLHAIKHVDAASHKERPGKIRYRTQQWRKTRIIRREKVVVGVFQPFQTTFKLTLAERKTLRHVWAKALPR